MDASIDKLFPNAAAEVKVILGRVRSLVQTALPDAMEVFYHSALGYGPTASGFDRILYIVPKNGYVNLGFFYGGYLSDPDHYLEGTGKRMRHIKVKTAAMTDAPELTRLVQEAWVKGLDAVAEQHNSLRKTSKTPRQ